jgi:RNA-binding protein 8A
MADFIDVNVSAAEDIADEDAAMEEAVTDRPSLSPAITRKGRGFQNSRDTRDGVRSSADFDKFEAVDTEDTSTTGRAQRSIEGWIVLITGVHEEAGEETIQEKFSEYGDIKNLHLNLDRRTGFVKGYALVEYETFKEAKTAIDATNSTKFYDQTIHVDFAFVRPPGVSDRDGGRDRRGRQSGRGKRRSASPSRIY